MGGVSLSLTLAPLKVKGRKSPKELYCSVRQFLCDGILSVAPAAAYRNALAEHFFEYGQDDNTETELSFAFYDGGGGLSVSYGAVCHWFQLAIAALREKQDDLVAPLDAFVRAAGYEITSAPEDLAALLAPKPKRSMYMVVRSRLLHLYPAKSGVAFETDEGQALENVTEVERQKMQAALDAQACACGLCVAMRQGKRPKRPKPPKPKPSPLAGEMAKKKRMVFNGSRWKTLPDEIVLAKNLTSLSVTHAPLTSLPNDLGALPKLTDLTLLCTKVTALPASFSNHEVLTGLTVIQKEGERHLKDFAVIASLLKLRRLTLNALGPMVAALDLSKLTALEWLELDRNQLTELPRGIEKSLHLGSLSLQENALTALPPSWMALVELSTVHLGHNFFESVPDVVAELPALETLDLGHNPITTLSGRLCKSRSLRHLVLTRTKAMKSLPKAIAELTQLTQLNLRYSGLTKLPDELSALRSLEFLSLEGLPLKELPLPVRALKKLKVLSVEETPMATLPEWISELPLEKLWLSKKNLARGELTRLSRLTRATLEVR